MALTDHVPASARARAVRTAANRLRVEANDLLCPSGLPDPELILGELPASLVIEPLRGEGERGYCTRMRQPGQWGSTAEILALTIILARPIRVYTPFGLEVYGSEKVDEETRGQHRRPLAIHFANDHYRAVTAVEDPDGPKQEL